MIPLKTPEELERMRAAGALLHQVREHLKTLIRPGITTKYLDKIAEQMIRDHGATPSFQGYHGYEYALCTSVDDQVVHGFPTDKPLREGQIVSVDAGLILHGWQADSAFTSPIGEPSPAIAKLIRVTEECFWLAANVAREGNRLGDISFTVQTYAEANGYGVIRDFTGHGIGREMHEDPPVPNFGAAGRGMRLRAGMTLAIEPMITLHGWKLYLEENGWTAVTRDHSPCAHYEHTVAITKDEPEILTLPGAKVTKGGWSAS